MHFANSPLKKLFRNADLVGMRVLALCSTIYAILAFSDRFVSYFLSSA